MRFLCLLLLLLSLPLSSAHSQAQLDTAKKYLGTTELTNHNDGPVVEKFLHSVGRHKGDSWCAAFVSYCLTAASVKEPTVRSGLARSFILKSSIKANDVLIGKYKIQPGTILVWREGTTIHGHVGFVESWQRQFGKTIEGNTTPSSSLRSSLSEANGDGVYRKSRSIQPGNYFRITNFTLVKN